MTLKDTRTAGELRSDAKESIEINGVRFSADEVQSVTIKRDGTTININTKNSFGSAIKGFAKA